MALDRILVKGAREHNLKNIDVVIPRDKLVVITGLSGSGKSTLAFDTIYAEGQRRYVESLSAYARQFLEQMDKPDVDYIEGLSPAISIEQKTSSKNPRSTVGTVTEIYDFLRVLFARIGEPYCWQCGQKISSQSVQEIVDQLMAFPAGTRIQLLAPLVTGRKGEHQKLLEQLKREGFVRVRINGEFRELEEDISLDKKKKHTIEAVVDRLVVKEGLHRRLTDSVELALKLSQGFLRVLLGSGEEVLFSERFSCDRCDISLPELTPQLFSFNNPQGACPTCDGLGTKMYFDPDLIVPNPNLNLREGAVVPWENRSSVYFQQTLDALFSHYHFNLYTPFKDLPAKVKEILLHGSGNESIRFYFEKEGRKHFYERPFEGVIPNLDRRYRETDSSMIREELERFMNVRPCPTCKGTRLKKESLAVKLQGLSIYQVTAFSVKEAGTWFNALQLTDRQAQIGRRILKEINDRLEFLVNVGLDYLTLNRTSATLSGGEGQRIRLATQIGSHLMGVLYVLDEPSIGLHPRDNLRLLQTLKTLRDIGNTVLVVEHDANTILSSDYVIDMGPGAGEHGGQVVFSGTPEALLKDPGSLTGQYLSGRRTILIPPRRRPHKKGHLHIKGASENNLKQIDVSIPLGVFTCVTGVSGSGKSTLIIDTLYQTLAQRLYRSKQRAGRVQEMKGVRLIDKVINIDQSPIGRTPRSNPATYTGLFTTIRDLFARTPEARSRGYKPGRFSFNVRGGRCPACNGDGLMKIEMHFLPDVYVTCEVCHGSRYNRDTLEVLYKGMNIAQVLDLTVDQALIIFEAIPAIRDKLETLMQVGLGYIRLGQPATTLSGGEAQRIKLSRELSKRSTGKTLYILDEPTTGLHFSDIQKLLEVLNRLVEMGNTVVVIEHNLDVIKTADYIIDLGPEGGDEGGQVIGLGVPEVLAENLQSYTGRFLKQVLGNPGAFHG
ncbi:MAG: excinuclease ABC subunit A [Deltaproteobacteria bacterium RBG_13_43_22]|nr:MAG: excinuclease ABC subunit A [Deltaproteobacteria bacterium RBG_13_43_22]